MKAIGVGTAPTAFQTLTLSGLEIRRRRKPFMSSMLMHRLLRRQHVAARPAPVAEDLHAGLVLDQLGVALARLAVERLLPMRVVAEQERQREEIELLGERRAGRRIGDDEVERAVLDELHRLRFAAEDAAAEDVDLDAALAVVAHLLGEEGQALVPGMVFLEVMRGAQGELRRGFRLRPRGKRYREQRGAAGGDDRSARSPRHLRRPGGIRNGSCRSPCVVG